MMIIDLLQVENDVLEQAANLLVDDFDQPSGWPNLIAARAEVAHILKEGFARAILDGKLLLGWIGGLPEYDGLVWELHPLVVRRGHRRLGLGRQLVAIFENEAIQRGALTATLGTDDDAGMTSLSGVNLYNNLPQQIADLHDLGRGHPFLFYQKLGYIVTGVVPDANGPGYPDIIMSKSLIRPPG